MLLISVIQTAEIKRRNDFYNKRNQSGKHP